MSSPDWNPETFTSRDMEGATCPKCGSEELQVEAFVGRIGHFNGFEMDEYEETDEALITWVKCVEEECENERPLLDRGLVKAAWAEERYQQIHEHWPPKEGEVQVARMNEDGTTKVVVILGGRCDRCASPRSEQGFCNDQTCPFSDHHATCPAGWAGHPERESAPCTCGGRHEGDE
jgi:hypothetical protein